MVYEYSNSAHTICFANLKVKDPKYRTLSDLFEFSTPKLCSNKWLTNYILILPSKVQCFRFQTSLNADNFITGCYILKLKRYINMYKSKYHWVLNKYISGFRKHRPHGDMGNTYALLSRFHWPCWLFYFVADLCSCVTHNYVSTYVERWLFTLLQHGIYHCNGNWISMCTVSMWPSLAYMCTKVA